MTTPSQKNFLTSNIDYKQLEICFYSDLEEGEYIVIEVVELAVYDVIIAPEKRKGWYDFFFLIYSEKEKKLMKLYPCFYTRRGMNRYYDFLKEDEHLVILEREKQKQGVRRPPAPKWHIASFDKYFENNVQFRQNIDDEVSLVKRRMKVVIDYFYS